MKTIVLISCGKTKHHSRTKARELYRGDLFKKSMSYAETLNPENIYILSAKHGLVCLDDELDPYEQTLSKMPIAARREWSRHVTAKLEIVTNIADDHFVLLSGDMYRRYLVSNLIHYSVPMEGLPFGKQLSWLGSRADV